MWRIVTEMSFISRACRAAKAAQCMLRDVVLGPVLVLSSYGSPD